MTERGATETEIVETVNSGERFAVRFGRTGFRRNFPFQGTWRGKQYGMKQLEVIALEENGRWLAITVIVKYF